MPIFTEAPYGNLVGKWVTYWGSEPTWYGRDFLIIDQGKDDEKKIAFLIDGEVKWRTIGASFSDPFDKSDVSTTKAVSNFLNPHDDAITTIDNEIARLTAEIERLKIAKDVLKKL